MTAWWHFALVAAGMVAVVGGAYLAHLFWAIWRDYARNTQ